MVMIKELQSCLLNFLPISDASFAKVTNPSLLIQENFQEKRALFSVPLAYNTEMLLGILPVR
jgi:hypothetical protein